MNYLYNFLVNNKGPGPYAEIADAADAEPGDIAQISFFDGGGVFNHSPIIISTGSPAKLDNIMIAAHTDNADHYPLTGFEGVAALRYIHILGVRA